MTWRSRVLALVLVAAAATAYVRGVGMQFGGATALAAPYTTEEAWIVNEVARDLAEMAAYPGRANPADLRITAETLTGTYTAVMNSPSTRTAVDLRADVWSPLAFAPLARAAFARTPAKRAPAETPSPVYASLLAFTPGALVDLNLTVSRALTKDMRNPAGHEAAALLLGAFAFREAADRSYDARWAINRMTAHLAAASALRGERPPGIDGHLATAVLLTLVGHEARALAELEALPAGDSPDAAAAWTRVIRLRITDDWREFHDPRRATRLEQREYFRARREAVGGTRGSVEAEAIGLPLDADTMRLMEAGTLGVADGWLLDSAFDLERAEYEEVYERVRGVPMKDRDLALNERASRLITSAGVEVLPWGAWAEFAQRHLATPIGRIDAFYRHSLAEPEKADAQKERLIKEFRGLWIFPSATLWWTTGRSSGDADVRFIDNAIAETLAAPYRTAAMAWQFLDLAAHFEKPRVALPKPSAWFIRPATRAAYDAAARVKESGHDISVGDVDALRRESPNNFLLADAYRRIRYGVRMPYAEARNIFGRRMEYDLRVLSTASAVAITEADRIAVLERSCYISPRECLELGDVLAAAGHPDEAASRFELALNDPLVDPVVLASSSRWLVNYYFSHQHLREAAVLAGRAAETGSFEGLATQAYLDERLGRTEDAHTLYKTAAARYDDPSQLLGFYYREVQIKKHATFASAWNATLEPVFPTGLSTAPFSDAHPEHGVVVTKDNDFVRKAGLQADDIIVGLEGFHVDNLPQYRAVNAFFETDDMKLTVWRGRNHEVAITAPHRLMGIEFRTYPILGWKE